MNESRIDIQPWLDRGPAVRFAPLVSIKRKQRLGWEAVPVIPREEGGPTLADFRRAAQAQGQLVAWDRAFRRAALGAFPAVADADDLLFLPFDTGVVDQGVVGSGHLLAQAREAGVDPARVVIEIRDAEADDHDALRRFIEQQRGHGFLLAVKDVGAGHSNLNRIALARPDVLMLSEHLAVDLDAAFYSREIVKSLVGLSKKIGTLVAVPGLSTEKAVLAALDLGVDMVQGPALEGPDSEELHRRIDQLADAFKGWSIAGAKAAASRTREMETVLSALLKGLTGVGPAELDRRLQSLLREHPAVECLFVLDESGRQVSETITGEGRSFKRSSLFHPARPGADHSMKEYFYLLTDTFVTRYRTEPYVSQASGNLCITLSGLFRDNRNENRVLCVDIPWEKSPPKPT
jgi:EAL domain-containing protein (putative c-di-GMP-specific phosphodiesterase class I)